MIVRLGDYVNIRTGKLDANASSDNGMYPFFTCSKEPLRIDTFSYECECVLVAGNGDLNVKYYNGKFDAYQRTYIIESNNHEILNVKYLFYFLDKYLETLRQQSIGGVIKYIKLGNIANAQFPLPELDKQRKITETLDKVSDLIAKRKQQLEKLDLLVKSKFVEMFGNFVHEKDRWNICVVGDVAEIIDPQPSHRTPPISEDGIPYIGINECNYTNKTIDFEKARKVGLNVLEEHIKRYSISDGDFIIGKIGTIGKPFYIPCERNYTLSANTVLIKPIYNKINYKFLFEIFQSEYMNRIIDSEKKSTSQPAFGIQKVRAIKIPLPPIKLQNQFAEFVQQTEQSKILINKSLEKLETLKKALMQEYFG